MDNQPNDTAIQIAKIQSITAIMTELINTKMISAADFNDWFKTVKEQVNTIK